MVAVPSWFCWRCFLVLVVYYLFCLLDVVVVSCVCFVFSLR